MGVHPWIVQDSLGILDVHGYSDKVGQSWVYILGLSRIFWVSIVYTDTQTQGVSHGCTSLDSPG